METQTETPIGAAEAEEALRGKITERVSYSTVLADVMDAERVVREVCKARKPKKLTPAQLSARCRQRAATAFLRRGPVICSLDRLIYLANAKRSVYCHNCWGLLPAAVVVNMSVSQVRKALKNGALWEYPAGGAR